MEEKLPKITNGPEIKSYTVDFLNFFNNKKDSSEYVIEALGKLGIHLNLNQLEELKNKMLASKDFGKYLNEVLIKHNTDLTKIKSSYKGLSMSEPYINAFLSILSIWLTYDLSLKTLESVGVNINSIAGIGIEPLGTSTALSASIAHYRHAIAKHIRNGHGILKGTGKLIKEGKVVKKLTMALAALGIATNVAGLGSKILSGKIQMGQQIKDNIEKSNQKILVSKHLLKLIQFYQGINRHRICQELLKEKIPPSGPSPMSRTLSNNFYEIQPSNTNLLDINGLTWYRSIFNATAEAISIIGHCEYPLYDNQYTSVNYPNQYFPDNHQKQIQTKLGQAMTEFQNIHGDIDVPVILEKKHANLENKINSLIDEIQVLHKSLDLDDDIENSRKIFNEINKKFKLINKLFIDNTYGSAKLYDDTDKLINYAIYGTQGTITDWRSPFANDTFKTNRFLRGINDKQLTITKKSEAMTPFEIWDHYDKDLSSKLLGTVALLLSGILINFSGLFAIGRLKRRGSEDENQIENLNQKKLIDEYLEKVIDQLTELINNHAIGLNILPHGIKVPRSIIKKAIYQCIADFQLTQESNIASSASALRWNSTIDYISGKNFAGDLLTKILPGSINDECIEFDFFEEIQKENHKNLESLGLKTPSMKLSTSMSKDGYFNIEISEIENIDNVSFKINTNKERIYKISKNTFAAEGKLAYGDNRIIVKGLNNESGSISEFIIEHRSDHMGDLLKLNKQQLLDRLHPLLNLASHHTSLKNQKLLAQRLFDIGFGKEVLYISRLDDSVYEIVINSMNMMELIESTCYGEGGFLVNRHLLPSCFDNYTRTIEEIKIEEKDFAEVLQFFIKNEFFDSEHMSLLVNKLFTKKDLDGGFIVKILTNSKPYELDSKLNSIFVNFLRNLIISNIDALFKGGKNENLNALTGIFINLNNYYLENNNCTRYFITFYQKIHNELITNGNIDHHFDILCSNENHPTELFQNFSNKFDSEDIVTTLRTICKSKPTDYVLIAFNITFMWINDEEYPKSRQDLEPIRNYFSRLKTKNEKINAWIQGILDSVEKINSATGTKV